MARLTAAERKKALAKLKHKVTPRRRVPSPAELPRPAQPPRLREPPTPTVVSQPPTPSIEADEWRRRQLRKARRKAITLGGEPNLQEQAQQDRERRTQELVTAGYSPHEAFRLGQYNPAIAPTGQRTGTATAMGQPTSVELYYQGILDRMTAGTDLRTRFEQRGGYGEYHPGGADPRARKEAQFGVWPGLQAPPVPDELPWKEPGIGAPKRYRARGGGTSRGAASPSYFALGLVNWRIGL